jgi:hypothetical protein
MQLHAKWEECIPHNCYLWRRNTALRTTCSRSNFTLWSVKCYFRTDGQSVSQSWCRTPLWGQILQFTFVLPENCFALCLRGPLWREDGSVICSAICQWSGSQRTRIHTLLSHLRLLGSLSVASYDSQGLASKVEAEVTLRLKVSQSVLVSDTALGPMTRFFSFPLWKKYVCCDTHECQIFRVLPILKQVLHILTVVVQIVNEVFQLSTAVCANLVRHTSALNWKVGFVLETFRRCVSPQTVVFWTLSIAWNSK